MQVFDVFTDDIAWLAAASSGDKLTMKDAFRHIYSHLLVGDMAARRERASYCGRSQSLSEPITTAIPRYLVRHAGVLSLQSGYAFPAREHPRILVLIDALQNARTAAEIPNAGGIRCSETLR